MLAVSSTETICILTMTYNLLYELREKGIENARIPFATTKQLITKLHNHKFILMSQNRLEGKLRG